ncbi:TSC22 domain family protein 1-like isoform X4 [Anguilla rostrata]|uniref:TSC22 domain family protein 1-like isoform X3 n=1 Tax=Anguilla anguilla TaxID=7936 RepID=UPI0015B00103|nr:TSC22 domain family protein 1-like isoform X3 [Anguilla anguilla]
MRSVSGKMSPPWRGYASCKTSVRCCQTAPSVRLLWLWFSGNISVHAAENATRSSGASVVAIDNKIEQAMDLVKSHLMYAVREEVEVLKEQIKELIERNSQLEQENNLLKNLASPEQLAQFQAQVQSSSPPSSAQPPAPPTSQSAGPSA